MKIIDAHTHIDYLSPNVDGIICCATKESDWQNIIDTIKIDKRVHGAFGIHPWFIDDVMYGWEQRLMHLLKTNSNYMIGEIGLDKYKPDMEKQIDFFFKQFDMAVILNRNVFLHCVGAWDKILYILKQYKKSELPIIVAHNFNENEQILKQLLQYKNMYFSLSKKCVYTKNCHIEQIPSDRILIETDGKKDISLKDIVMKISEIKNDNKISDIIYNNTKRILKNG